MPRVWKEDYLRFYYLTDDDGTPIAQGSKQLIETVLRDRFSIRGTLRDTARKVEGVVEVIIHEQKTSEHP